MADASLSILITGQYAAMTAFRQAERDMRSLGLNMIDMGVSATRLASDFDGAMTSIARSTARMGLAVTESLMTMGVLAGGVLAGIGAKITKEAADFQSASNFLVNQAGMNPAQLPQMQQGLLGMSNQVGFGPNQLANAAYYIESSGIHNVSDALATETIAARGAQVGHADLIDTTKALTSVMTVYGDSVDNAAGRMGQILVGIGQGKLTMQDFTSSFGMIGPILASANVPFEQYIAMLDQQTLMGLAAARGNTTLRYGIENLVTSTKTASAVFKELGINQHQFADEVLTKGPVPALVELKQKMDAANLAAQTQDEVFKDIFGGIRGQGLISVIEGETKVLETTKKVGDITQAQIAFTAMWAVRQGELNQQWDNFQASLQMVGVQLGTAILPKVTPIVAAFAQDLPHAFSIVQEALISFGSTFVSVLSTLAQTAMEFAQIIFTAFSFIDPTVAHSPSLRDNVVSGVNDMKAAFGSLVDVTPVMAAIGAASGELNVSLQDLTEEGLAGLGKTDPIHTLDKALRDMVDSAKADIQTLRDQLSGLKTDLQDALAAPLPGEIPAQIGMQKIQQSLLEAQAKLAEAKANALHVPPQTPGPSGQTLSSAESHVAFARSVGGRSGNPNENPAVKAAQAAVDRITAQRDVARANFERDYSGPKALDELLAKQATTTPVTEAERRQKIATEGPTIKKLQDDITAKTDALHQVEAAWKGISDAISAAGGAAKNAKGPIDLLTGPGLPSNAGIKGGSQAIQDYINSTKNVSDLFKKQTDTFGTQQEAEDYYNKLTGNAPQIPGIQFVQQNEDQGFSVVTNPLMNRLNQGADEFKKKLEGWTTELNTFNDRLRVVLASLKGPELTSPNAREDRTSSMGLGGIIEASLDKSLEALGKYADTHGDKIVEALGKLAKAIIGGLAKALEKQAQEHPEGLALALPFLLSGHPLMALGADLLGPGLGPAGQFVMTAFGLGMLGKSPLGKSLLSKVPSLKTPDTPETPAETPDTPTGAPTADETPDITDAVTKISSETGMPEDQIAWWRGGAQAAEPGATAAAPEAAEAAPGLLGGLGKALGPVGVVIGTILQAKSIWDTVQNMGQNKTNPNSRFNIPGIDQPLTSDQVKSWFSSPSKTTPSGTNAAAMPEAPPPSPAPGTFVQTGPGGQGVTTSGTTPGQNAVSVPGLNNIKVPNELGDNLSTQIATDLTTSLPDAVQKADPGTALATGFTTSIISAANEILNGAMTFFKQFSDGLTGASAFDTGSPSKWSANVAQDVVDGFSQGIDDHVSDVDPSIQKFLDEIKKQIGSLKDKDAKKMGLDLLDSIVKGLSSPTDTSKIQDEGKSLADSFSTGFLAEVQNRLAQADLHVDVQTKPQPTVSTHDTSGVDQLTAGPRQSFASGGSINAALGEPVLAMVHGGETVLNPKQTALLAPHLARANVPGFAEGGLVGNIPVTGSPSTGGDVPVTVGPTAYSVVISDADLVKLINKAKAGNLMPGGWKPSEVVDILDLLEGTPLPGSSTSGELGDALAALEEDYTGNALAGDPSLSPEDFIQKTQAQWANLALWMQMNAASAPWKPAAGPVPKVPVVLSGLGTLRDNWVMDSNSVKKGLLPADQAIPGPQGWNSEEVSKVLTNLSLNSNKLESDTPTPNTGELAIALSHFAENAHSFGALSNVDKTIPEWVNFVLWLQDNDVAPSGPVSVTSDPDIKYDAFQSWRASLTSAEKKAVGDYIGNSKNLNRFLRGGRPRPNLAVPESALDQMMQGEQDPARLQQQADNIIAALKRSKITEPLRVYRGFTDRYLDKPLEVGENFVDPGFVSTSLDSAMAENFAGDYRDAESANRYIAEIDIPAGATGAYINPDEEEVLLPAGGSFDVTNIGKPYDRGRYVFTPIMMQYTPGAHGATPVTPPAGRGGFTGLPDWEGPLDEGFSALQKLPTSTGFSGLPDWMSGKSGGFSGLPKLPTSMGFTGLPGFAQPGAPNLEAFEQGGFISGSGPRPVIAHGGEYVLSQDVVKAILHGNGGTAPSNDTATERTGGASFHFHAPLIGQATLGSQMDIEQTATALVEGMRRSADSVWRHSAVVPITSRPKV